jgi:hypothetical protein
MKAIKALKALIHEAHKTKHPSIPPHLLPAPNVGQNIKNKERKELFRIEKFCDLTKGIKMNRIENSGKRIDNTKIVTDVLGNKKKIGSVEYRRSSMQNGIADLVGLIHGRYYAVELKRIYKNGKDRQSNAQKIYQKEVEDAGGVYVIINSFEHFYEWYNELNA